MITPSIIGYLVARLNYEYGYGINLNDYYPGFRQDFAKEKAKFDHKITDYNKIITEESAKLKKEFKII